MSQTPAGWYPDPQPNDPHQQRWWDGENWSTHLHSDAGDSESAPAPDADAPLALAPEEPRVPSPYDIGPTLQVAGLRESGPRSGVPSAYDLRPGEGGRSAPAGVAPENSLNGVFGVGAPESVVAPAWGPSGGYPTYPQPAYGQPAHEQPAHQQPVHQQPAYEQPGQPPFGQSATAPAGESAGWTGSAAPAGVPAGPVSPYSVGAIGAAGPTGSESLDPVLASAPPAPAAPLTAPVVAAFAHAPASPRPWKPIAAGVGVLALLGAGGLYIATRSSPPPPAPKVSAAPKKLPGALPTPAEAQMIAGRGLLQASDLLAYRIPTLGAGTRDAVRANADLDACVEPGARGVIGAAGVIVEAPDGKTQIAHSVEVGADRDLAGRDRANIDPCLVKEMTTALQERGVLITPQITLTHLPLEGKEGVVRAVRIQANFPNTPDVHYVLDELIIHGPLVRSSARVFGPRPLDPESLTTLLTTMRTRAASASLPVSASPSTQPSGSSS